MSETRVLLRFLFSDDRCILVTIISVFALFKCYCIVDPAINVNTTTVVVVGCMLVQQSYFIKGSGNKG